VFDLSRFWSRDSRLFILDLTIEDLESIVLIVALLHDGEAVKTIEMAVH
jgi:hypothetical protein